MSDIQPLVSIIIPTYNGSKRITRTLESIINQDYENLEMIIVDDVSTDNTVEICKNVLEGSSRKFRIVKREKNGHQSAARNSGLKVANGKYVIFFDHDDLCERNFVSSLCNEAEAKEADLVLCVYQRYYEDEDRYVIEEKLRGIHLSPEQLLFAGIAETIPLWSIWNVIFKKALLDKYNLRFNERCYILEDKEFSMKAVATSAKVSTINQVLYTHIHHSEQQTFVCKTERSSYKAFTQELLALWRVERCVRRHIHDKFIRDYVLNKYVAGELFKYCMLIINAKDYNLYSRVIKNFSHKKIRLLMINFALRGRSPSLLLEVIVLMYFPKTCFKYLSNYKLINTTLKAATRCAQNGRREEYEHIVKHLRHKTMRELMLSSVKFIFKEPELLFKSLMLIYFPNFYYKARSKKS